MAVVEISVTPLGTAATGVSAYVARCVKIARNSGLKVQLTPMGTILDGAMDEIWKVLMQMHNAPFVQGAERVSTLIKIDDRRDGELHSMEGKVASVENRLS
ncbi:MAG: hypothetical protein C0624_12495 [Desulfuromonas sp.]|nr:MAG: hypothetical protein C0624_12495 [Desulfuromonas sp.]